MVSVFERKRERAEVGNVNRATNRVAMLFEVVTVRGLHLPHHATGDQLWHPADKTQSCT